MGPGDEVVTVPNSFVATSWAISYVGARPVFVDVVPGSWTMDVERLEAAITERTRAVLPVHLYGHPCDLPRIAAICRARGVALIEDAAQAHGAAWEGIGVGAAGLASCFSFYPSKNLGACGEAGAVCTDDDALARRLRRLRNNAQGERNQHEELGFNYRMDGLQAAILGVKLKHLRAWNERRTERARLYARGLQGMPNLELPRLPASARSAWHLFVVHHPRREALRQALAEAGVETGLHYPRPIHLQEAYRCLGHGAGAFPVAEYNASRCLSLPLHAELAEAQLEHVCGAVRGVLRAPGPDGLTWPRSHRVSWHGRVTCGPSPRSWSCCCSSWWAWSCSGIRTREEKVGSTSRPGRARSLRLPTTGWPCAGCGTPASRRWNGGGCCRCSTSSPASPREGLPRIASSA